MALAGLVIGTYGLFSQEQDPLSGVFLIPLGLPWVFLLIDLPEALLPWLAVLSPLLNLAILLLLCRYSYSRKT